MDTGYDVKQEFAAGSYFSSILDSKQIWHDKELKRKPKNKINPQNSHSVHKSMNQTHVRTCRFGLFSSHARSRAILFFDMLLKSVYTQTHNIHTYIYIHTPHGFVQKSVLIKHYNCLVCFGIFSFYTDVSFTYVEGPKTGLDDYHADSCCRMYVVLVSHNNFSRSIYWRTATHVGYGVSIFMHRTDRNVNDIVEMWRTVRRIRNSISSHRAITGLGWG